MYILAALRKLVFKPRIHLYNKACVSSLDKMAFLVKSMDNDFISLFINFQSKLTDFAGSSGIRFPIIGDNMNCFQYKCFFFNWFHSLLLGFCGFIEWQHFWLRFFALDNLISWISVNKNANFLIKQRQIYSEKFSS